MTRDNRQFLARAVTWAANQGISHFIDLGCGMPTVPNTHETAQEITMGARVAYVDNDAVVLSHLRALAPPALARWPVISPWPGKLSAADAAGSSPRWSRRP